MLQERLLLLHMSLHHRLLLHVHEMLLSGSHMLLLLRGGHCGHLLLHVWRQDGDLSALIGEVELLFALHLRGHSSQSRRWCRSPFRLSERKQAGEMATAQQPLLSARLLQKSELCLARPWWRLHHALVMVVAMG